jgi:hypothetical protein
MYNYKVDLKFGIVYGFDIYVMLVFCKGYCNCKV